MKEIIDAIKNKLTDNKEENVKILLEELEKNKNNKEVHDAIYKMIFENLPENLQGNLVRKIGFQPFVPSRFITVIKRGCPIGHPFKGR